MPTTRFEVTVPGGCWIELCDPTREERAEVEQRYGVAIPDLDALSEIESSSRLRREDKALVMSAPLLAGGGEEPFRLIPTGFILLPEALITVHYGKDRALRAVAETVKPHEEATPAALFARLLEHVVDHAADQLEAVAAEATSVSHEIFYTDLEKRGLKRETALLGRSILRLGRASERASRVRYMFLSIGRMAKFVVDHAEEGLDAKARRRLQSVGHDIASLDEFEISLSGRIQFLLDAATSLVGIRQNDVVGLLTVASVIGIPPVLVVGVYGMNFHVMPELSWPWGYPFALGLCVLSGALPYLWFKWRKWV
ncbi:magnesium transporter CorA family protein [Novosphingobium profundi]|uniref:magnesium transporter CorA family protein n=1 Tax=Novosphingobium profundi TaxID=1774954 RepID=UPI001BDB4009|nr:magnesium transporter CorA family protein [Novosphingobium profundi]MBT0669996.1 magnesium transporter CorA family protein [Novosphingobium profundi]